MTFVDLAGKEKIKASMTDLLPKELLDVSKKENTFCKAEDYFTHLQGACAWRNIRIPGDWPLYSFLDKSEGYTPEKAAQKHIPFTPERSGYAGKENPVGKRF